MTGRARSLLRMPGLALTAAASMPLAALARLGWQRGAMRIWGGLAARAVGLRVRIRDPVPAGGGLLVVNHVGYLDILAVSAACPGTFLAKSEIASWPLFGFLSRWGGTVFVRRERFRDSRRVIVDLEARLRRGERVILFPEAGVSPDASLGPFRPMLFQACVETGCPVIPAALRYAPPDPRFWAWIDEPSLWRHLTARVLPAPDLAVEVRFGTPIRPAEGEDRKGLAARARTAVAELLG